MTSFLSTTQLDKVSEGTRICLLCWLSRTSGHNRLEEIYFPFEAEVTGVSPYTRDRLWGRVRHSVHGAEAGELIDQAKQSKTLGHFTKSFSVRVLSGMNNLARH